MRLAALVFPHPFAASAQRVGPIWTGDNTADWRHLRVSIPMVLSINLAGIAFSGDALPDARATAIELSPTQALTRVLSLVMLVPLQHSCSTTP
jgi:hypothetical protein